MQTNAEKKPANAKWLLLRDVAVLQVKLLMDGLRDLVLVPASIIAAALSLMRSEDDRPGPQFYQLLAMGRQSEHWIDLFGALRHAPFEVPEPDDPDNAGLDDIVDRVENYVRRNKPDA